MRCSGVPSPFFPGILLSRKPPKNLWGNGRCLKRTIAEKHVKSTPRVAAFRFDYSSWRRLKKSEMPKTDFSRWGCHLRCKSYVEPGAERSTVNCTLVQTPCSSRSHQHRDNFCGLPELTSFLFKSVSLIWSSGPLFFRSSDP